MTTPDATDSPVYTPVLNPGATASGFALDRFGGVIGSTATLKLQVKELGQPGWPRRRAATIKLAAALREQADLIDEWAEQYPEDHSPWEVDQ